MINQAHLISRKNMIWWSITFAETQIFSEQEIQITQTSNKDFYMLTWNSCSLDELAFYDDILEYINRESSALMYIEAIWCSI